MSTRNVRQNTDRERNMSDRIATDFEERLRSLCPESRLDRDRLMFLAGQAAVQPAVQPRKPWRRWFWPAAAAAMTVAAGVLGVLLAIGPEPRVVRETVYVNAPTPQGKNPSASTNEKQPDSPRDVELVEPVVANRHFVSWPSPSEVSSAGSGLPRANYFHTRHVVLALGVDALPQRPVASGGSAETLAVRDVMGEGTDDDASESPWSLWPW